MEITQKNFSENFDIIKSNLKSCCFIGFDAEFTAILSNECFKHRLFDSNEERYNKLRTEVSKMIMTQVGLTLFQYDREWNTYNAIGYTFHLCPQVFGDIDQSFIFQASTLKFLCKHNFDFNKFTYEGIPYLSKGEENKVRQYLNDDNLFNNIARFIDMDEEKILQMHCSEVSKWLTQSEEDTMFIDLDSPVLRFIVHNELRIRFPDILTNDSLGNSNKIVIYRNKNVEGATSATRSTLEEKLMNHLLSFSRILNLLYEFRKPIIGHNIFLDLVLLHNQFIGPLPTTYSNFKKNISEMLPNVYDTKYISHEMRKKLSFDEVWKSNALQDLYEFFHDGKCKRLENARAIIKPVTPFKVTQSFHEAGWDSYVTGYSFIRLGHWVASENSGHPRLVTPTEIIAVLSKYRNKINIIRGAMTHMNLEGDDPPMHRPQLLYVKSINGTAMNVAKMATLLSGFGSIDVKPCGKRAALVAASTQFTLDKILKQFHDSREYRASTYNVYKHTLAGRMTILSGALFTGSLVLYLLHKK